MIGEETILLNAIGKVGFPIAVASILIVSLITIVFMLLKKMVDLRRNTEAIDKNTEAIHYLVDEIKKHE